MKTDRSMASPAFFPDELQTILFGEVPIKDSLITKKIHELIFTKILKNFKLPLPVDSSAYIEVMKHFREHCKFFLHKAPNFVPKKCKTIIEMKKIVEDELKASYDCPELVNSKLPLLGQLWCRFLNQIDPITQDKKLVYHLRPQAHPHFNDAVSQDPNQDVQFFLGAGARNARFYPDVLGSIIKQAWCTARTVELLLDCGFEVTAQAVITALNSERFKELFPKLLQSLKPELRFTLVQVCKIPSQHYLLLENYIDYEQSTADALYLLINQKFPEEIILKIIENQDQIESQSSKIITRTALDQGYSRNIFMALFAKIDKETRPHCLEEVLRKGYYPDLIERFLVRDEKAFNPWVFFSPTSLKIIIASGYSEEILCKIIDHVESLQESHIELAKESGYSDRLIQKMQNKTLY